MTFDLNRAIFIPPYRRQSVCVSGPRWPGMSASDGKRRTSVPSSARMSGSPSRATMLTGLYPHHHRVTANDIPLSESVPSLGHVCKQAAYATAYFGKWHLGGAM